MSKFSFQEKMLWAQLVGILVVGTLYAELFLRAPGGPHYFHGLILVLLFLFATVRLFLRRGSGNVLEDERDRAIACIGSRWSNVILWVGLVLILLAHWDRGSLRSSDFLAGILFHLLILAALARIVRELVAYRTAA